MIRRFDNLLLKRLPKTKGEYIENAPIGKKTWFRTGGLAEVLFEPHDKNDLISFIKNIKTNTPLTIIGRGSNLLVRDGGVPGVVIKLNNSLAQITFKKDKIEAGAGILNHKIVQECKKRSVSGLEFLVGIPGSIGGAVAMNSGAYGKEIKDIVQSVEIITKTGKRKIIPEKKIKFQYRKALLPKDSLITQVNLNFSKGKKTEIEKLIKIIQRERKKTQPINSKTCGSTFRNPKGCKAWELIDKAGCRGMKMGSAMISDKHCNFIINTSTASAKEIEALGKQVIKMVKQKTGVKLEWEIKRVGSYS